MTSTLNTSIIEALGLQHLNAEQSNFLKFIERKFKIVSIEDLHFQNLLTASEFLTYSATKIYLALSMNVGMSLAANATVPNLIFMNEIDTSMGEFANVSIDYVTPDQYYGWNPLKFQNVYFSRLQRIGYEYLIFNGFKLVILP